MHPQSDKLSLKKLSFGRAILLLAIFTSTAGFFFYKFLSTLFVSEYTSKLQLLFWGIPLFLIIAIAVFLTRKITSRHNRIIKKAEEICPQEDRTETVSVQGQNDLDRLEHSLDLLARGLKRETNRNQDLESKALSFECDRHGNESDSGSGSNVWGRAGNDFRGDWF